MRFHCITSCQHIYFPPPSTKAHSHTVSLSSLLVAEGLHDSNHVIPSVYTEKPRPSASEGLSQGVRVRWLESVRLPGGVLCLHRQTAMTSLRPPRNERCAERRGGYVELARGTAFSSAHLRLGHAHRGGEMACASELRKSRETEAPFGKTFTYFAPIVRTVWG